MSKRSLTLLSLALLAGPVVGQGQWTSVKYKGAPSARLEHAMTRSDNGTIVLFGGAKDKSSPYTPGTYQWNGKGWRELTTSGTPPTRGAHAMGYDDNRQMTVLFGGWSGSSYFSDTWELKNAVWSQAFTSNNPPERDFIDMEYDPNTQAMILFGGHDWRKQPVDSYSDTWIYDGNDWTELFPATVPPNRHANVMAQDKNNGTVLMFGGKGAGGTTLNDTWSWNGTDWTKENPTNVPPARAWPGMEWDPATQTVLLFGGADQSGGVLDDVWSWDGSDWTLVSNGPIALSWCPMAYDPVRQEMLIQGGSIDGPGTGTDGVTRHFSAAWNDLGLGLGGSNGVPVLRGQGPLASGATMRLDLTNGRPTAGFLLVVGFQNMSVPFAGGTLIPTPDYLYTSKTDAAGAWGVSYPWPNGVPAGVPLYFQAWIIDPTTPHNFSSTNGLNAVTR